MGIFDFFRRKSSTSESEAIRKFNQDTVELCFGGMKMLEDYCRELMNQLGLNKDTELVKGFMISAASCIKLNGSYDSFRISAMKLAQGRIKEEQLFKLFIYVKDIIANESYHHPNKCSALKEPIKNNKSTFDFIDETDRNLILTDQFIYRRSKENNFVLQEGRVLPTDKSLLGMSLSAVFVWLRAVNILNHKLYLSIISKYQIACIDSEENMREFLRFHFKIEAPLHIENIKKLYPQGKAIIAFLDSMAPQAKYVAENMSDKNMLDLPYDYTEKMTTIYGFEESGIAEIIGRDYQSGVVTKGLNILKNLNK